MENLSKVTQNIERPFAAILGGSKISDKTKVVNNLLNIADSVLIGGGMAYTFLKSEGIDIGKSLREDTMIDEVKKIMAASKNKLFITKDSNCANSFADVTPIYRTNEEGYDGLMALDIGKDTVKEFENVLSKAKTIF
ncbi:hypothetical protein FACS189496_4960 [Bacilli bacterium]|nr:hypothetical protein FACS189496_4960 [Bacilli bacterium]